MVQLERVHFRPGAACNLESAVSRDLLHRVLKFHVKFYRWLREKKDDFRRETFDLNQSCMMRIFGGLTSLELHCLDKSQASAETSFTAFIVSDFRDL